LPRYQQYNAAADTQQQGFGNIIQGAGMAGTSTNTRIKLILENLLEKVQILHLVKG
jgi:hypothetical protein